MRVEHISFDLDGTLVNSHNTIYKTTLKAMEHLGITGELREKEFYGRIGHHFLDIFKDMEISVPDIELFINIYKGYYFDFIDTSSLYPGVTELLEELSGAGIKISLLTTKAQDQADMILDHFRITPYFSYIMGRRPGMGIKPSAEPLLHICRELGTPPASSLMVGDSDLDINCGKNAGTLTCGVTWGYRTAEFLKELHPDYIIDEINQLRSILRVSYK